MAIDGSSQLDNLVEQGYIEEHALTEAEKGFNQTILYGKESSMADILTHARRFPMMAEKQVVIVKEAQEIYDLKKESGQKLLENYLNIHRRGRRDRQDRNKVRMSSMRTLRSRRF